MLMAAVASKMHSLHYYFNRARSEASSSTGSSPKPIDMEIGKQKHPVGQPRKAVPPIKQLQTAKLVDYSTTESEAEETSSEPS